CTSTNDSATKGSLRQNPYIPFHVSALLLQAATTVTKNMVTTPRASHRRTGAEPSHVGGPSSSSVRGRATSGRGPGRLAAHRDGKAGQPQAMDEGSGYKHTIQIGVRGSELSNEVRRGDMQGDIVISLSLVWL
ncbi:hypothetical protein Vafri_5107, partial [Volvox africanus]